MTGCRSTQVRLIETKSNAESVIEFKAVFDRRPVNSGPAFGGSTVFTFHEIRQKLCLFLTFGALYHELKDVNNQ